MARALNPSSHLRLFHDPWSPFSLSSFGPPRKIFYPSYIAFSSSVLHHRRASNTCVERPPPYLANPYHPPNSHLPEEYHGHLAINLSGNPCPAYNPDIFSPPLLATTRLVLYIFSFVYRSPPLFNCPPRLTTTLSHNSCLAAAT